MSAVDLGNPTWTGEVTGLPRAGTDWIVVTLDTGLEVPVPAGHPLPAVGQRVALTLTAVDEGPG